MVADPAEHVSEPRTRIDVVQLGSDDKRIHRCSPLATTIGKGLIIPWFRQRKLSSGIRFIP
jgi:hypothetical protein